VVTTHTTEGQPHAYVMSVEHTSWCVRHNMMMGIWPDSPPHLRVWPTRLLTAYNSLQNLCDSIKEGRGSNLNVAMMLTVQSSGLEMSPYCPLVWALGLIYIWFWEIQNTSSKGYKHEHTHGIQEDCSGVQDCYVKIYMEGAIWTH